jgi:hypothetical protein
MAMGKTLLRKATAGKLSNAQWKKKHRSKPRSGGLQTADSLNGDLEIAAP